MTTTDIGFVVIGAAIVGLTILTILDRNFGMGLGL